MRLLLFRCEFPPPISGGIGTACYGIVKGLSKLIDVEVIVVVPNVLA